jgi:hypothetical protein
MTARWTRQGGIEILYKNVIETPNIIKTLRKHDSDLSGSMQGA